MADAPVATWRTFDISPTERILKVSVPGEAVRSRLAEKVKILCRTAQVKGFRRGKVPESMVKKLWGEDMLLETARDLVAASYEPIIEQVKATVLGEPVVEGVKVSEADGLSYEIRFDRAQEPAPGSVVDMTSTVEPPKPETAPGTVVVDMTPVRTGPDANAAAVESSAGAQASAETAREP